MAVKDSVRAIPIASFDSANLLPATWQAITPAGGIPQPCFMVVIRNVSNRLVTISGDDININDVVPAGEDLTLDFQTNSLPNNRTALIRRGTVISLRGAIGGTGNIHLIGYYQEQI